MAVNLLSFSINGVPIDELKATINDESVFELPFDFESTCPPISENFIDHPNKHIRTQTGGHYPRDQVYCSKGKSNIESNKTDGFSEVRRKELFENSTKLAVLIDPSLTKEIIEKKLRSKQFNEYPRKKDWGPQDKPFEVWREDRKINLIMEDSYYSTGTNRGRNEISHNEEIVIGNFSKFFLQKNQFASFFKKPDFFKFMKSKLSKNLVKNK